MFAPRKIRLAQFACRAAPGEPKRHPGNFGKASLPIESFPPASDTMEDHPAQPFAARKTVPSTWRRVLGRGQGGRHRDRRSILAQFMTTRGSIMGTPGIVPIVLRWPRHSPPECQGRAFPCC